MARNGGEDTRAEEINIGLPWDALWPFKKIEFFASELGQRIMNDLYPIVARISLIIKPSKKRIDSKKY